MLIYGLHSGDGVIRYVGLTIYDDAEKRRRAHVTGARIGQMSPKDVWIRECGLEVQAEVLQRCEDRVELAQAEIDWIWYYRVNGEKSILNQTDGGDGARGRASTPQFRERMREIALAQKWSPERREAQRQRRLGAKNSEESKRKIRASLTGRKVTDPERLKVMSAARKKAWDEMTPEKRAAYSETMKAAQKKRFDRERAEREQ